MASKQQPPRTNLAFRPNKAKVPKLHPDKVMDRLEYVNDSRVGESFVTIVAGPKITVQITYHHPIGETSLRPDAWVATMSSDVPFLLSRTANPNEMKISQEVRDVLYAMAAADLPGVSVERGELLYNGRKRSDLLYEARKKVPKEDKKSSGKSDHPYLPYLDAEARSMEVMFLDHSKRAPVDKIRADISKKYPFETKGGASGETPQVAVPGLSGLSLVQAQERIMRMIVTGAAFGSSEESEVESPPTDLSMYRRMMEEDKEKKNSKSSDGKGPADADPSHTSIEPIKFVLISGGTSSKGVRPPSGITKKKRDYANGEVSADDPIFLITGGGLNGQYSDEDGNLILNWKGPSSPH